MNESESAPGWVTGQIATLGIAIAALIAEHPNRNVVLASIAEHLDHLLAETRSPGLRAGIASARRMYIPPPLPSHGDE